jgi:hypothetical protein
VQPPVGVDRLRGFRRLLAVLDFRSYAAAAAQASS